MVYPHLLPLLRSSFLIVLGTIVLASGCATSTIETRKQERLGFYGTLPADQKELVDRGQIKVGMPPDAVYIAWGPPAEVVQAENEHGQTTTWIYQGQWMEEARFWTFRETDRDGTAFLERNLETEYFPRRYIRAEIIFVNGAVKAWRTLPKPAP